MDKKKSCIKIISNISHNNVDYEEIFNQEFQELTNIGNRFRIRHHEIGKIEIIDPNYYDYLYHRCFVADYIVNKISIVIWQSRNPRSKNG